MRSKFILTLLATGEIFLVVLLLSPGFWHPVRERALAVRMVNSRTPMTVRAYQEEHAFNRDRRYFVCTLAVLNGLAIIIYGGLQQQKRMD